MYCIITIFCYFLSFIVVPQKLRWVKLFDHQVRLYDPDFKPLPHEFGIERKKPRPASPWFYLIFLKDKALLSRMRRSTRLAEHFLSICRNYSFTEGLGCEAFWGSDLWRYRHFWLPPQDFLGYDLDDLVSRLPIKIFATSSIPSFHKWFYPEYGPLEFEISPLPSEDLTFTFNSNLVDSSTFFMLMIEPPQEKVQFTFFTPSFHHGFYPEDEPEKLEPGLIMESSACRVLSSSQRRRNWSNFPMEV